jgi:hypothetical protein
LQFSQQYETVASRMAANEPARVFEFPKTSPSPVHTGNHPPSTKEDHHQTSRKFRERKAIRNR